jgi:tRNA nucleotidyltransferase/poly(A) polymerase
MDITIPTDLRRLADLYTDAGHEVRMVGGCVRDAILGQTPKDLDLATTATPDEQIALAERHCIRHVPLGLEHGTVGFVIPSGIYEITTLRSEDQHDGRHAVCAWSRDWTEDAARRDLTINAMSLEFDGRLHDPFGGYDDLNARRVRFVGDPDRRIQEDYLRALRFVRFHARIAGEEPLDIAGAEALRRNAAGLAKLSAERIRSEMEKILTGPHPAATLRRIEDLGLLPHLGLPTPRHSQLDRAIADGVTDGHDRLAAHLGYDPGALATVAARWKLPNESRDRWAFIAAARTESSPGEAMDRYRRHLAVDKIPVGRVVALAMAEGHPTQSREIAAWPVPRCPVNGNDLMAIGHRPGKAMGETMRTVIDRWADTGYGLDRNSLLRDVPRLRRANAGPDLDR